MLSDAAGINDVVADFDAVSLSIASLYNQGELMNALEFCSLAEAVVLHDTVIIVDSLEDLEEDKEQNRTLMDQFLAPWKDTQAIRFASLPSQDFGKASGDQPTNDETPNRRAQKQVDARDDIVAQSALEARNLARAEKAFLCPGIAFPRQLPFYETSYHVQEDHSVCTLAAKYEGLSNALTELRKRYRMPKYEYITLPIPPIALQVFSNAADVEELVMSTLRMREEYLTVRSKLSEVREIINDETVSMNRKERSIKSWERTWKTLDVFSEGHSLVDVAKTSTTILKEDKIFDGISFNELSWLKLVGEFISLIEESFHIWRIRSLHRTAYQYKGTSDAGINHAISKALNRELSQAEVSDTVEVFQMMQELASTIQTDLYLSSQGQPPK